MNNQGLGTVKQAFGFFSMSISWAFMNIIYAIYFAWRYGKNNDSGIVISWSGIFFFIAWVIFIIGPLFWLNHQSKIFKPLIFPFITCLYGMFVYTIIVGGLFQELKIVLYFLPFSAIAGFIFGSTYSFVIRKRKFISTFSARPFYKLILYLSPVLFSLFFLVFLPVVAPGKVFRYMPDTIQDNIFAKTISKYKVGDKYSQFEKTVPYYFEYFRGAKQSNTFTSSGSNAFIEYDLEVKNDTITKLVLYSKR